MIFLSGCMRDAAGMITLFVLFIQELMQHARLMEERMSFTVTGSPILFWAAARSTRSTTFIATCTNYLQEGTQLIDERHG
ncbi:MAG: hypothetical protein ACLTCB_03940 [Merdibacter sp.]